MGADFLGAERRKLSLSGCGVGVWVGFGAYEIQKVGSYEEDT